MERMPETPKHDVVDVIVREWSTVRADLDPAPLEVFSRVKRIAKQLDDLRKDAFADAGLEPWEFDVLSALRRAGGPHALTPKQLLATNLVSSGTMTNRIDRLAARGLVVRQDDPADGRSGLVVITDEGIERVDEAITRLIAEEEALLAGVDPDEADALARGLRALSLRMGAIDD